LGSLTQDSSSRLVTITTLVAVRPSIGSMRKSISTKSGLFLVDIGCHMGEQSAQRGAKRSAALSSATRIFI
jgi:hypothetical protein